MAKRQFSFAFATTATDSCESGTGVWAWELKEMNDEEEVWRGTAIDDFFATIWDLPDIQNIYTHGLKFYSYFIFDFLLNNGFKYVADTASADDLTFTAMILPNSEVYSIDIYFEVKKYKNQKRVHKVTLRDTEKMISLPVFELSSEFKLEVPLTSDYMTEDKPNPYEPTWDEWHELDSRCDLARAVWRKMRDSHLYGNTLASSALRSYKDESYKRFLNYFPALDIKTDAAIREAYIGGFNYLNPKFRGQETGKGTVIDVNSMYPFILSSASKCRLPVGEPIRFTGKYTKNTDYPLYIQRFSCMFRLKPGGIPTIRMRSYGDFDPHEYVTDSKNNIWTLTLAAPDLHLFFKNYEVFNLDFIDGWMFETAPGIFDDFIYSWIGVKNQARAEGDKITEYIAKSAMNMLGGKFAAYNSSSKLEPYIDTSGTLDFVEYNGQPSETIYVPVAIFMTAYARYYLITMSQRLTAYGMKKNGEDPVIYHDTDCIASLLSEEELREIPSLHLDDFRLGAFKIESRFERARWLRQKTYCLDLGNDIIKLAASGLPSAIVPYIKYDDFMAGFSTAKLDAALKRPLFRAVPGGAVIDRTDYTF